MPHRIATQLTVPPQTTTEAKTCSLDRVTCPGRVEVLHVTSDHGAKRQLAHLGILVGAIIAVKKTAPLGGPVLVEVRGSLVAIGRGLARKVLVEML